MLDTKPAAEPLAGPQVVRNLIDHLPQEQRASLQGARQRIDVELYIGRDGWIVARVRDWQRYDVLFKGEGELVQYQCSCPEFRTQAPVPCLHVALTAMEVLEQTSSMMSEGSYPYTNLKPLLPARPVAGMSADGAICLLRQNGQPVLRSKKLSLPWKPYFEMLRSSSHAVAAPETWQARRGLLYGIR